MFKIKLIICSSLDW